MNRSRIAPPVEIAHIFRLPNEILLKSFEHFIDDTATLRDLSLVCRFWHHFINNSPILWSKIDLYVHRRNSFPVDVNAARRLERAGGYPLTLKVDCSSYTLAPEIQEGDTGEEQDAWVVARFERLAERLQGCMDRWQELSIIASLSDLRVFFRICVGATPQLKYFSTRVVEEWAERHENPPLLMPLLFDRPPESNPNMTVSFKGGFSTFTPSFGLGLANLCIDINDEEIPNPLPSYPLLNIIESCPNLRKLQIKVQEFTGCR